MEVADATNMLIQMVREIEANDFHRFAAPVYGKGFIKLFAKAVGLDPAPLIAEFIASQNEPAKAPRSTAPKIKPKPAPPPTPVQTEATPAEEVAEEKAEPPPTQQSKRLKASTVTMPRADSPFAPGNRPPPRQPVASRPPIDDAAEAIPRTDTLPEPRKSTVTTPLRPEETSQEDPAFALESDTVVSDRLPEPTEEEHEPFRYPTRARPAASADTSTDQPTRKRKTFRPPGSERPHLIPPEAIAQGVAQLKNIFAALRERITNAFSMDNDEDSKIRKRYAMTGVLVCMTVLITIIIATSGPEKNRNNEDLTPPLGTVVETNTDTPAEMPPTEAEVEAPLLPTEPVRIVRVLSAPKMFAR